MASYRVIFLNVCFSCLAVHSANWQWPTAGGAWWGLPGHLGSLVSIKVPYQSLTSACKCKHEFGKSRWKCRAERTFDPSPYYIDKEREAQRGEVACQSHVVGYGLDCNLHH